MMTNILYIKMNFYKKREEEDFFDDLVKERERKG